MVEQESTEKTVEVKEKPFGPDEVKETERVTERSTAAQRGRAEQMAGKSGEIIGAAVKKTSRVIKEFASGFSKQMKSSGTPKEGPAQRTEYRSEQTRVQEASPAKVLEKTEEKVTKEE